MFCNQCGQTPTGGCSHSIGVCGKTEDLQSLQETLIYGLKGVSAYYWHARQYGKTDPAIDEFIPRALFATLTNVNFNMTDFVQLVLEAGEKNLMALKLLDEGQTERYGAPVPVEVPRTTIPGPAIMITGHDLLDLEELLKQTEGKGINIYTNGEMLPAHGYPKLKAYKHLVGNYAGPWFDQKSTWERFTGPIVVTTNCVMPPKETYADRIWTMNMTGIMGDDNRKIVHRDFSKVIEQALSLPPLPAMDGGDVLVTGFHQSNVLALADKIIEAVKSGAIKHFYVVGGCDTPGSKGAYYTEFVEKLPADTVVLTLDCGKYRINHLKLGTIGGIPRLLDLGQCNNTYSAVQIAVALAGAFNCGVNDLPLSIVLTWFEQKAVADLLTLLHLGVKGVFVGPKPPQFLTPNVFKVLSDTFDLRLISTVDEDMKLIHG